VEIEDDLTLPVYLEMQKSGGAPLLWMMLSKSDATESDILQDSPEQLFGFEESMPDRTVEDIISKAFFAPQEPPRWILLIGMKQIALLDRSKWNEKRYLLFELEDIFERREESTLQAMSVLLHKDTL